MAKIYHSAPDYNEQNLRSTLNMDNLFEGGDKTLDGLSALSHIVKDGSLRDADEALDILDDLSHFSFRAPYESEKTKEDNANILCSIWELAQDIAQKDPSLTSVCYQIGKQADQYSGCDLESGLGLFSRDFFEKHFKKINLAEDFNKDDYNPWSPWRSRSEETKFYGPSLPKGFYENPSVEAEAVLCREMLNNMADLHTTYPEHSSAEWRFNKPELVATQILLLSEMMHSIRPNRKSYEDLKGYTCPEEKEVVERLCKIQEEFEDSRTFDGEKIIGTSLRKVCSELFKRGADQEHIKYVFEHSDRYIPDDISSQNKLRCIDWLKESYMNDHDDKIAVHRICDFVEHEAYKKIERNGYISDMRYAFVTLGDIIDSTSVLEHGAVQTQTDHVQHDEEIGDDCQECYPAYNIQSALKAVSKGNYGKLLPNERYLLAAEYDDILLKFAEKSGMKEDCAEWLIAFNKKIGENNNFSSRYPEHLFAKATKTLLAPHIEKRKEEIKARLHKREQGGAEEQVSGLEVNDSLIEMRDKVGTITPDKAKALSPIIKEAFLAHKAHKK